MYLWNRVFGMDAKTSTALTQELDKSLLSTTGCTQAVDEKGSSLA